MGDTIEIIQGTATVVEVAGPTGPQGPAGASQADVLTQQGDILYRSTVAARLPIGTAGQILKVNSGGTAPEWGAAPAAGVSSVNGATGAVSINQNNLPPVFLTYQVDEQNDPLTVDLGSNVVSDRGLNVFVVWKTLMHQGRFSLLLPHLAANETGRVAVRTTTDDVNFVARTRVQAYIPGEQGSTYQIFPASGYDEPMLDTDYVFRWTGCRWDLEILHKDATPDEQIVNYVLQKPTHAGILATYSSGPVPTTPTSSGAPGQLAWGFDGTAQRLYICVANNTWRRIPIATW